MIQMRSILNPMVAIITLATIFLFLPSVWQLAEIPDRRTDNFRAFVNGSLLVIAIQWCLAGLFCLIF